MTRSESTLVVLNPSAGGGRAGETWNKLEKTPGLEWLASATIRAESPEDLIHKLSSRLTPETDFVIAAGGDGTVHHLVNALMKLRPDSPPALGILPLGNGSDLTSHLGIPARPEAAIEVLLNSAHHPADLLKIDTGSEVRWCANICSVGITAEVAERMNRPGVSSKAYLRTATGMLGSWKGVPLRLISGGIRTEGRFDVIAAGNGSRFGGGLPVFPGASHNDGICELLWLKHRSIVQLLPALVLLPFGKHRNLSSVKTTRCRELIVEPLGSDELVAEADGETFRAKRLHIKTVPGAIRIAAPD